LLLSISFALDVDIQATGGAFVRVSLTNTKPEPLTLLAWNTPFDDNTQIFRSNIFNVAHSTLGVVAEYSGIELKRILTLQDFVTLRPGQTISTILDMHKGYNFPVAGEYKVTLNTFVRFQHDAVKGVDRDSLKYLQSAPLHSGSVLIQIDEGSPPLVWETANVTTQEGLLGAAMAPTLVGCTGNSVTLANNANSAAGTMLNQQSSNIAKGCSATNYVTWFGTCSSGNVNTVSTTINNARSRQAGAYRLDCSQSGCPANTYAYVYPSDTTFTVHLCSAWFTAATGTCRYDSQGGTIIHELSHFSSVGGTQDYAYGTAACQNLARSNPSQAIRNADSYEYMHENCGS